MEAKLWQNAIKLHITSTYNKDFFFFFRDAVSSAASFVSRFLDFLPSLSLDPKIADSINHNTITMQQLV